MLATNSSLAVKIELTSLLLPVPVNAFQYLKMLISLQKKTDLYDASIEDQGH